RRSTSKTSTSARLSACAAAIPAKPAPTIKTRFFRRAISRAIGVSGEKDLVSTVVIDDLVDFTGKGSPDRNNEYSGAWKYS
ncbi:MAG TPA: hypothetical protein VE267_07885, partial [Bradyrhizobium sp.]|nr:hypothetical protein [Bradyrhizobium sp.]